MKKALIFIILLAVANVVSADEGMISPYKVNVDKKYFRLHASGCRVYHNGSMCSALLGPEIPDGKVFVADYAAINIRVVNAPADLEGFVAVHTGFVSNETLPSLGKLERVGDEFVLGEKVGFIMVNPSGEAKPLGLFARFSAPFPDELFCWGRIDGRLIDRDKFAEEDD